MNGLLWIAGNGLSKGPHISTLELHSPTWILLQFKCDGRSLLTLEYTSEVFVDSGGGAIGRYIRPGFACGCSTQ